MVKNFFGGKVKIYDVVEIDTKTVSHFLLSLKKNNKCININNHSKKFLREKKEIKGTVHFLYHKKCAKNSKSVNKNCK